MAVDSSSDEEDFPEFIGPQHLLERQVANKTNKFCPFIPNFDSKQSEVQTAM